LALYICTAQMTSRNFFALQHSRRSPNLYQLVTVSEDYRSGHPLVPDIKLIATEVCPMLCSIWTAIFSLPGGLEGGHLIQTGISPNGTLLTAIAAFLLLLTKF
jgi:hypothetical protein